MTRPTAWTGMFLWAAAAIALSAGAVQAHSMNAAFLGLQETVDDQVHLRLKIPAVEGRTAPIRVTMPERCEPVGLVARQKVSGAMVDRWTMACGGPLRGEVLRVTGLDALVGEVFILYEPSGDDAWTTLLRREAPETLLGGDVATQPATSGYLGLGFSHILEGPDHLLFVLALLLVIRRTRRGREGALVLLGTITAFTLAHSLTLALATVGAVRLPSRPTEVVIALSVLLLACELAARDRPDTLTMRRPWLVAFGFGLLHGFGFAGALMEIGLPEDQVALPLLLFNVGVEAGQVAFVGAVGALGLTLRLVSDRLGSRWTHTPRWAETAIVYVIGTTAVYWCIDRVSGMG